jgi:hypothetical protein
MKKSSDLLPAALKSTRLYDGQIYTRKELIDHLILKQGFVKKRLLSVPTIPQHTGYQHHLAKE